jgi:hypothetical protein
LSGGVIRHHRFVAADEAADKRRRTGTHHHRVARDEPIQIIRGGERGFVRFAERASEILVVVLDEQMQILLCERRQS